MSAREPERTRLFLTAIRSPANAKYAPLWGALLGILGGAVYWLGVQIWPANIAVILSIAATALLTTKIRSASLFYVFIKYNALMALSAAKLPFAVPSNFALGFIMICGYAASFALVVAMMAIRPKQAVLKVSFGSLALALLIGFTPAAWLGVPGLIGLAAAITISMGFVAYQKYPATHTSGDTLGQVQMLTEACFYLGALSAWSYI